MKYILQFGIIICVSFVGEALGALIPLSIPGSIYGMVIMFLCLAFGIIKPEWIEKTAEFLLSIMTIMFLPAIVGLIPAWGDVKQMILPAIVVIFAVTVIVMGITGKLADAMIERKRRKDE